MALCASEALCLGLVGRQCCGAFYTMCVNSVKIDLDEYKWITIGVSASASVVRSVLYK